MAEQKKRFPAFWVGIAVYVLVFAVLSFFGLKIFRDYIAAYEQSRPGKAMEEYRAELTERGHTDAVVQALSALDPNIRGEEENLRWAEELLREASFPRMLNLSDDSHMVYSVRSRGQQIGQITAVPGPADRFGFRDWTISEESYDFSAFMHSSEATIPADYSYSVNGVTLGREYITEENIPFETLADFYDRYEDLPTMVHYRSGLYLDEAEVQVTDPSGHVLSPDEMTETYYLDNCGAHIRELADEFIPRFLQLYVNFTANLYNSYSYNFANLRPLVLSESQLNLRMRQAAEGFGYTTTKKAEILSMDTLVVTRLSADRYLADITYVTEITGHADPVVIEDHIYLVMYEHKDYLLAEALYNH